MMRHARTLGLAALVACTSTANVPASASPVLSPDAGATATIHDASGNLVGNAAFTDTHDGLLVTGNVSNVGLGAHGIHIHTVGKCEAPFTSAGGHFNPGGKKHGFKAADGPHLGDLPNIHTPSAGSLAFEFMLPGVTLKGNNALLDADGAAIVIHATQDDYMTDPAGNSGARIACGVITAR